MAAELRVTVAMPVLGLPPGRAGREHFATRIRTAQTVHLPGLFQTEEHARAIFEFTVPRLPRLEVELRVAHRMSRQSIVTGENATPYLGIIHEAALRLEFGGRDVARRQLAYLAEVSELAHVTLLVIPFHAGAFHGAGQSILYTEGPVAQLDTVQLDTSSAPAAAAVAVDLTRRCR
ncbi:DUF5753 domain-containing protein [Streptomyces sp. NPDC001948]